MAAPVRQGYVTPKEYLAHEREAVYKSEYIAGQIIAISGASREHSLIGIGNRSQLDEVHPILKLSLNLPRHIGEPRFAYTPRARKCDEPHRAGAKKVKQLSALAVAANQRSRRQEGIIRTRPKSRVRTTDITPCLHHRRNYNIG